jgi:hypothetical protein
MRRLEARAKQAEDIPMNVFRTVLAGDVSETRPLADLATAMVGGGDGTTEGSRRADSGVGDGSARVRVATSTTTTGRSAPDRVGHHHDGGARAERPPAPPVLSTVLEASDSDSDTGNAARASEAVSEFTTQVCVATHAHLCAVLTATVVVLQMTAVRLVLLLILHLHHSNILSLHSRLSDHDIPPPHARAFASACAAGPRRL